MKKQKLLFSAILLSGTIIAQTNPETKTDSIIKSLELKEVTVTVNRMEQKLKEVPQKLEIITSKDIQNMPTSDVGEIIKQLAALDVIQRPGIATYATIRGFRPPVEPGRINPEVSVLINGRQSGTQNLALFDPNSIERIEILKGAAGAIYGSSAMGGIINIITKKTIGETKGYVYGGYGSFETSEIGYSVGGNITSKFDFDFSGTFFDRNDDFKFGKDNVFRKMLGSDKVDLYPTTGPNANTTVSELDTAFDGRKRNGTQMQYRSNSARLGYQITKNWRVDVSGNSFSGRGIESSGDLRLLNAAQGFANRFFNNGDARVTGNIGKNKITVVGYLTEEENSTFNSYNGSTFNIGTLVNSPTYQASEGIVKWSGIQVQDVYSINNNIKITIGADYNEAISRTKSWTQASYTNSFVVSERAPFTPWSYVKNIAPFAQANIKLFKEKLILNPSARYDFIDFGIVETPLFLNLTPKKEKNTFISPSFAMQYNIIDNLSVHGNIGRAFRYAQAFELAGYFESYIPGNKVRITTGNSNLKNEESMTWDAGVKFNKSEKGLSLDVTYFQTKVKNKVRQVSVPEKVGQIHTDGKIIDQYLTYENVNEANIEGLEFTGAFDFGSLMNNKYGLRLFANFTHLMKAEDVTKARGTVTEDVVVKTRNVAKYNLNGGIEFDNLKNFTVRLSTRYISKRYSQDFSNLDPFLRGAYMDFPEYLTMDLNISYTVKLHHMISLRVSNLTDENYYESRGFNLPGRFIGLRYTYKF